MVSELWTACSAGDLQKTLAVFNDHPAVDIELKDHAGVTALIEAVRHGHVEIVRVLLEKGADPTNASSHGRPEQYTSDPAILELLHGAQSRGPSAEASAQPVYANPGADDPEKRFYAPPPPDAYTYYPTINPSLSTVSEAGAYYQPSQGSGDASPGGPGNLPPPEVARMIPCRYFPACRYGAQCMFAHPQTPYFQGPMPPPYPPYDPMGNPYVPQYYQPPPPPFQPQPGAHPMSPPPVMHARTPSEVMSPSLGHFSPNGAPPPPSGPYGHLSPPIYPHPGHVPMAMQPIPPLAPLPPLHPHAPHHPNSGPQPHPNLYNSATSPVPPFPLHQEVPGPYPMPPPPANINYDPANGVKPEPENYNIHSNHPNHREGLNHRRGAGRRPSFSARKPPCLFFPAGRCKNGDECRFPHVLPENGAAPPAHLPFAPQRAGPPRPPRGQVNGPNGFHNLEAKLGNLTLRDDQQPRHKNGNGAAAEGSSRSHSSDAGTRPKFQQQGSKNPNANGANGHANNNNKKSQQQQQQMFRHQQRVPNADEFPVLAGSTTPPTRTPVINGFLNGGIANGPTAAQVLQAPPPRKDSKESSTRGPTPDPVRGNTSKEPKAEANGVNGAAAAEVSAPVQQEQPAVVNNAVNKLPPMSFAAAATSGGADVSKEVSVSA
ncbi:hypothetical protein BDN70DRAFT_934148 [Pholiota conissans]|uniref:C3H1-type domain-containing protein n=1 Tax=Pholiota conissans TaxID=109636 RepID=A0A9P6CYP4_9AGAR|nr:hypothetical protein BDN70DRAFT_934148 [Pholiota conissans]